MAGIVEAAEQGKLVPTIGQTVPLSEAIPALIKLEKNRLTSRKISDHPRRLKNSPPPFQPSKQHPPPPRASRVKTDLRIRNSRGSARIDCIEDATPGRGGSGSREQAEPSTTSASSHFGFMLPPTNSSFLPRLHHVLHKAVATYLKTPSAPAAGTNRNLEPSNG